MRSVALSAAGLLLTLLPGGPLEAQLRPLVHAGNRVRIVEHAGGPAVVRTVFDVRGDTLLVGDGTTPGLRLVHVPDVRRVHVSRGLQRSTGRGVVIGSVAALPVGAGVGAGVKRTCRDPELCVDFYSREEMMLIHAVGAGVIGGLAGALVGSRIRSERWERVRRGRYPAMAAAGADGRVSLGMRLTH